MPFISRVSVACLLGASLLVSCGGGGNGSTSTPTPPPNNGGGGTSNGVPVAVASSAVSTVTEGGEFTVTAANSSDPDGDNLTFTWTQTAGPNALSGGTIQATSLTLNAPIVTQDTDLTFEVIVSDGTASSTDTVTVTAQPIDSPVTVRPSAPINMDVAFLNGITNEGTDQYRVYWADGFVTTANNIIASQIFSDAGAPVGNQINGSFDLPQAGSTFSTQIQALFPISVIENGGVTYAPLLYVFQNAAPALGNLVGPLEGNLSPVANPFATIFPDTDFDQTSIGQNNIINVTTVNTGIDTSIRLDLFNPDGSVDDVPVAFEEITPAGLAPNVSTPAVSPIGDGGYIAAWRRENSNQSPRLRTIEAQIYTSENALSGQNLTVDATAGPSFGTSSQLDGAVFGNGNTLITWVESQNFAANGDFIDFVVRGRIVSPDGTFASDEFTVSDSVNDQFVTQALSLSNGDVLVIWGEGDSTLKARLVSTLGSVSTLGAEFDLSQNVQADVFRTLQTQTGRVLIGYNLPVGNNALTSEIISFCPVGCE